MRVKVAIWVLFHLSLSMSLGANPAMQVGLGDRAWLQNEVWAVGEGFLTQRMLCVEKLVLENLPQILADASLSTYEHLQIHQQDLVASFNALNLEREQQISFVGHLRVTRALPVAEPLLLRYRIVSTDLVDYYDFSAGTKPGLASGMACAFVPLRDAYARGGKWQKFFELSPSEGAERAMLELGYFVP